MYIHRLSNSKQNIVNLFHGTQETTRFASLAKLGYDREVLDRLSE